MKIFEAISLVDEMEVNTYGDDEKIRWISWLDGQLYATVHMRHANPPEFHSYECESMDTELLVPYPFDQMYILWLRAQMDLANGEISRYNEEITAFNALQNSFIADYKRSHMPVSAGRFRF